jgi:hypothetical protein
MTRRPLSTGASKIGKTGWGGYRGNPGGGIWGPNKHEKSLNSHSFIAKLSEKY